MGREDIRRRLFDTDTFSLYRRGDSGIIAALRARAGEVIYLSVFTVDEALSGWYNALRQARSDADKVVAYIRLEETIPDLALFPLLPLTAGVMTRYRELQGLKLNVRPPDLRIAALALENDVILVTRNLRDFQRVPGLTIENWAS